MTDGKDKILKKIKERAAVIGRPLRFMGLCGTHSQTIAGHNIKSLLPENITLASGPGCPVCVTDQSDIDIIVGLALKKIPVAVYGDAANVPGNIASLEEAGRGGADVNIIYDVAEALKLKKAKPNLVFFGIGFETTAPMTAWAIKQGLVAYSAHKIFPPAMAALLKNKKNKIDGFINPGHVSAVIGAEVYEKFKIPQVIAGFEAIDVLQAVNMLLGQITKKEAKTENEYSRVVKREGNKKAMNLISEVFEIRDARWRGLGLIKKSGLKIRRKYKQRDAEFIYRDIIQEIKKGIKPKPSACRCGLVLQGLIEPEQCPWFKKVCAPSNPQGACMVSVEGACSIAFRFAK